MSETPSTEDRAEPGRPGLMHKDISVPAAVVMAMLAALLPGVGDVHGCGAMLLMLVVAGLAAMEAWRKKRRFRRVAVAAVGIALLTVPFWTWVYIQGVREHAEWRRTNYCRNRLAGITDAVQRYMREHDETPPPSLQPLVDDGRLWPERNACPSAESGWGYFIHFAGLTDPESGMVVCDLKGNHGDHRNVLYGNSSLRTMDEDAFQAELVKPENAAFAAELREFEGKQGESP